MVFKILLTCFPSPGIARTADSVGYTLLLLLMANSQLHVYNKQYIIPLVQLLGKLAGYKKLIVVRFKPTRTLYFLQNPQCEWTITPSLLHTSSEDSWFINSSFTIAAILYMCTVCSM